MFGKKLKKMEDKVSKVKEDVEEFKEKVEDKAEDVKKKIDETKDKIEESKEKVEKGKDKVEDIKEKADNVKEKVEKKVEDIKEFKDNPSFGSDKESDFMGTSSDKDDSNDFKDKINESKEGLDNVSKASSELDEVPMMGGVSDKIDENIEKAKEGISEAEAKVDAVKADIERCKQNAEAYKNKVNEKVDQVKAWEGEAKETVDEYKKYGDTAKESLDNMKNMAEDIEDMMDKYKAVGKIRSLSDLKNLKSMVEGDIKSLKNVDDLVKGELNKFSGIEDKLKADSEKYKEKADEAEKIVEELLDVNLDDYLPALLAKEQNPMAAFGKDSEGEEDDEEITMEEKEEYLKTIFEIYNDGIIDYSFYIELLKQVDIYEFEVSENPVKFFMIDTIIFAYEKEEEYYLLTKVWTIDDGWDESPYIASKITISEFEQIIGDMEAYTQSEVTFNSKKDYLKNDLSIIGNIFSKYFTKVSSLEQTERLLEEYENLVEGDQVVYELAFYNYIPTAEEGSEPPTDEDTEISVITREDVITEVADQSKSMLILESLDKVIKNVYGLPINVEVLKEINEKTDKYDDFILSDTINLAGWSVAAEKLYCLLYQIRKESIENSPEKNEGIIMINQTIDMINFQLKTYYNYLYKTETLTFDDAAYTKDANDFLVYSYIDAERKVSAIDEMLAAQIKREDYWNNWAWV